MVEHVYTLTPSQARIAAAILIDEEGSGCDTNRTSEGGIFRSNRGNRRPYHVHASTLIAMPDPALSPNGAHIGYSIESRTTSLKGKRIHGFGMVEISVLPSSQDWRSETMW